MLKYNVPFFANTPDNLHCFQASLMSVLSYFGKPNKKFSFSELDEITGRVEGMGTWPQQAMIWMKKTGYDVRNIEFFDYSRFVELGIDYLIQLYGKEVGDWQSKHSNLQKEVKICRKFLKEIKTEVKIPDIDNIKDLLNDGYLVISLINYHALVGKAGYSGHMIVVTGYDDNGIYIHDPGLPPMENKFVRFEEFEKAWAYPDRKARNIMAFKYNKRN